ncbi:hypothetical protein WDZ92_30675, partial [Nostoc sp. NIES-2111]
MSLCSESRSDHDDWVIVRAGGRRCSQLALEIWLYRGLLWFFVWRDLKLRYRQTLLGVAWVVLQPLALMAAYGLVLGRVVGSPSNASYPVW